MTSEEKHILDNLHLIEQHALQIGQSIKDNPTKTKKDIFYSYLHKLELTQVIKDQIWMNAVLDYGYSE